ncbi:MAG: peptidase C39 family protein [Trueperaceae bacterium]|nr:peptidase C39 family protein [Trueperaceae bacterium]
MNASLDVATVAPFVVRRAERADLDALEALEGAFPGDRISRASFARFVANTATDVWVAQRDAEVIGDAVVVYRRGFVSARIYTLVVAEHARGTGVAKALLAHAERGARERGCVTLRLEVRDDNESAIALYRRSGYEVVGRTADYYEDGSAALRLRKRFVGADAHLLRVPYYAQTLDFTCGPAALLMAMRAVGWEGTIGQEQEVAIWREATTVYMLAGHGGTSAHGLAVAARRRGVRARVWVDTAAAAFVDSVRDAGKKAVIELAHRAFTSELASDPDAVRVGEFTVHDVVGALARGEVPVVLVSAARLHAERAPHWVVITGYDDDHLYVHDPHLPDGTERADGVHLALPRRDFAALSRYGRARHRAMVVLAPSP